MQGRRIEGKTFWLFRGRRRKWGWGSLALTSEHCEYSSDYKDKHNPSLGPMNYLARCIYIYTVISTLPLDALRVSLNSGGNFLVVYHRCFLVANISVSINAHFTRQLKSLLGGCPTSKHCAFTIKVLDNLLSNVSIDSNRHEHRLH